MAHRPIITLTTDFGHHDHFIGTVKGVILSIVPEAEIVDISHELPAFDILEGALTIASAYLYFPAGTVHMVVVDPGVGTARRPIVSTTGAASALSRVPTTACSLWLPVASSASALISLPPRTIFSSRSARPSTRATSSRPSRPIWLRVWLLPTFGEEIRRFHPHRVAEARAAASENTMRGTVIKVDHFGNLITNITPGE